MPDGLYLVFSHPPAEVSAKEYDDWYVRHLRENLEAPGFRAGRRFEIERTNGATEERELSHLALYETDAELGDLRAGLDGRLERGEVVLPEWFGQIRFSSWHCRPLEERVEGPDD